VHNRLANYIRARRKSVGLSQRELAFILGYADDGAVSQHELNQSVPPLIIGLGYEVIFQVPMSELFAGLREGVEASVEQRIARFEKELLDRPNKGGLPDPIANRKLIWLKGRRPDAS